MARVVYSVEGLNYVGEVICKGNGQVHNHEHTQVEQLSWVKHRLMVLTISKDQLAIVVPVEVKSQ